jgi:hypothetical protein
VGEETETETNTPEASTDSRIPEPLGLSTYIQLLGEWAKGMVSEPYLLGLIRSKGFGDTERTEFLTGADRLWGLVPPIDAPDVAEAELPPEAARALGLALTLQGQQALHHHLPSDGSNPPILSRIAEMVTVINLILEGHEAADSAVEKHLTSLQQELAARSVDTSRLADRKEDVRDAVLNRRHLEERAQEAQAAEKAPLKTRNIYWAHVPMRGFLLAFVSLGIALVLLDTLTPEPSGGLPPASSYTEVPVLGIIRHPDVAYVLVQPEWLLESEAVRKLGARRLWERLSKESGGNVAKLVFRTRSGTDLGYVTARRVRWQGPLETASPLKLKVGSDRSTASGDP